MEVIFMLISVLSGLIVSVDAFFIGLSLGLQKKCKFLYLAIINAFLFGLCLIGFMVAGHVYESIPFDPDLIVGLAFIALGIWSMLSYFVPQYIRRTGNHNDDTCKQKKASVIVKSMRNGLDGVTPENEKQAFSGAFVTRGKTNFELFHYKSIGIVGIVMSAEAMLITMGITIMFIENATILIPITVAVAHFGYSTFSFFLARTNYAKRIPIAAGQIISGIALIIYGLMALFVEIGVF